MEASGHTVPSIPAWQRGRVASWLVTTDHKRLGKLYIGSAGLFFVIAGLLAIVIRTQLAQPDQELLTRDNYSAVVTWHGTAMVFFVLVPLLVGLANVLVPLMIGASRMAFPRLNAFSFWLFAFAGVVLVFSKASGGVAGYPPLSTLAESSDPDLWILAMLLATIAPAMAAINFVVTIRNMRAAGMTSMRMPSFVWAIAVFSLVMLIVLPAMAAALTLLLLERHFPGTFHFFTSAGGGNALIYQHALSLVGHPAAYILVVPALGIISEIVPVFSGRSISGYRALVLASAAIGSLALLGWAGHLSTAGYSNWVNGWFMIASLAIAVPAIVKIANWLTTLWLGNLRLDTPMLFALGFVSMFTLGVLSGIYLAALPTDWQVQGTHFEVANLHYLLFGGSLFAVIGGLWYWWPKLFGRLLDERLGKATFALLFAGFNLSFLPEFLLGLLGMPRHVYTYSQGGLWEAYNLIASIGSYVTGAGVLVLVVAIVKGIKGRRAGNDPWTGDTLEWYTTSPPPPHNFDSVPPVTSARPLHDLRRSLEEKGAF